MSSYDRCLEILRELELPRAESERRVAWTSDADVLGLARHASGGFELFITGDRLNAISRGVSRHLRYDRWERTNGATFAANRLVLPAAEHFLPVTAFLATELVRAGVQENSQLAFSAVEPTIELALNGSVLSEEHHLGLLGELLFFELGLRSAESAQGVARVFDSWKGFERSARDFEFNDGTCFEAKVTTGQSSRHPISSLAQVDPKRAPDGSPTERLYLLSIGLDDPRPEDAGRSLPQVVDAILALLASVDPPSSRNAVQELFLLRVEAYGSQSGTGYDHDAMASWGVYQAAWRVRFIRAYNMCDPVAAVLRYSNLDDCEHVLPESVKFIVSLPDVLTPQNPVSDLTGLIQERLLAS
jgi:hypothetical protein